MNVLLFGATGLLGHNVLLQLLEKGHAVVALVRNAAHFSLPDAVMHSSLLRIVESPDPRSCSTFPAAPFSIINCAGTTDMSLLRYDDYLPGNVALCRHLIDIAEHCDVRSIVHVSTANTIGYGDAAHPAAEDAPMLSPFDASFYARSKREGERLLQDYADTHPDRHVVILNPGFMVGPYDVKPSSGRLLLAAYRRPLMAAPGGGKSFVHVADVARAAVNALTMGRSGHRYLLAGENLRLRDFYALQALVCGYRQTFFTLPDWLTSVAGRVGDVLRLVGVKTQLSLCNVRQLQTMEYYSHDKAQRELDFHPVPIRQAIADFFLWHAHTPPSEAAGTQSSPPAK